MAISGAAANPRGGFAGTGPTTNSSSRSRCRSSASGSATGCAGTRGPWLVRTWLNPHGNHFVPVASDSRQLSACDPPAAFVELTDGGHFENLGLYELVRRRCGLIIVCDGGDDRRASYAALSSRPPAASRRTSAPPSTSTSTASDRDAPTALGPAARSSPARRRTSTRRTPSTPHRGYFLASVRYGDGRAATGADGRGRPGAGLVIYLKSAMIPALSLVTRAATRAPTPTSPTSSTADQFFSPEQFEAYRDVGVCDRPTRCSPRPASPALFGADRPPLSRLRGNPRFRTPDPASETSHRSPIRSSPAPELTAMPYWPLAGRDDPISLSDRSGLRPGGPCLFAAGGYASLTTAAEERAMVDQQEKFERFKALHDRDRAFVIPNPWDAGSARLLSSLGFEALATTSAGYAFSKGRRRFLRGSRQRRNPRECRRNRRHDGPSGLR